MAASAHGQEIGASGTVAESAIRWWKVVFSALDCLELLRCIQVFQGSSSMRLDAKGRFSVPTRHREALMKMAGGQLTLTQHPDGCLLVFPRNEWEVFRGQVAALPMSAQWWKRIFLGNAQDVEMDGTGRVLVAPELRDAAQLGRDALLLGMGSHFELWDKATYKEKEASAMKEEMPEVLKNFSF